MTEGIPLLRPLPQRTFQITPSSTEPSTPPTPEPSDHLHLEAKPSGAGIPQSRTHSILNLTSSTLFGIYSPGDNEGSRDDLNTPWGTGAMTPASPRTPSLRGSIDKRLMVLGPFDSSPPRTQPFQHHVRPGERVIPVTLRTTLLFIFGMAYGVIVTHLHDDQRLAPVKVGGIDRHSWYYLIFWGIAGVALGSLLPWVDVFWEEVLGKKDSEDRPERGNMQVTKAASEDERQKPIPRSGLDADWNQVVRSIGAFIGIGFAIRKLPWQSTLQVSLTLALVNPVLWYLIDRSKPGFLLSTIVGLAGTAVLVGVNPEIVPSPATLSPMVNITPASYNTVESEEIISHESIAVWTWIASVLFCSSVCFGNIGRRLAFAWPRNGKSIYNDLT